MDEEARLAGMARRTVRAQAQAQKCACSCGCQYPLVSRLSAAHGKCFGCRAGVHYGGRELTSD